MKNLKLGFAPLATGSYTKPAPTSGTTPTVPISSFNGDFALIEVIQPIDYLIIAAFSGGGLLTIVVLSLTLYFSFVARDKLGVSTSSVKINPSVTA